MLGRKVHPYLVSYMYMHLHMMILSQLGLSLILWDGEVAEKNQLKNAFRTLGIRRVDHKSLEGCWL